MTDAPETRLRPARVAVVTGGTSGIGFALARELSRRGLSVAIAAPEAAQAAAAAGRLAGAGGTVLGFGCDVRRRAAVDRLAGDAAAALGPIDLWVNNAGVAVTGNTLVDVDPEVLATMLDIHCLGALHGCQAAYRAMKARGGAIYNMLGAGADGRTVPRMGAYATSKAALAFLTRAFAADVGDAPLVVGGLSPGLVITEGFLREHAKTPPEARAAREAVVNLIGDHPGTTARWAADILLSNRRNGAIFTWLTPERIEARRQEEPSRNILNAYIVDEER